jgi:hypothetical protein
VKENIRRWTDIHRHTSPSLFVAKQGGQLCLSEFLITSLRMARITCLRGFTLIAKVTSTFDLNIDPWTGMNPYQKTKEIKR